MTIANTARTAVAIAVTSPRQVCGHGRRLWARRGPGLERGTRPRRTGRRPDDVPLQTSGQVQLSRGGRASGWEVRSGVPVGGRSALHAAGRLRVNRSSATCGRLRHVAEALPTTAYGCACLGGRQHEILDAQGRGPGLDRSPSTGKAAGLGAPDRWIGMWSARVLCAFGVGYAVTMVASFAAMGNLGEATRRPLPGHHGGPDPRHGAGPGAADRGIHPCVPDGTKTYSMTASARGLGGAHRATGRRSGVTGFPVRVLWAGLDGGLAGPGDVTGAAAGPGRRARRAGRGRIVAEFFDTGYSRTLA